MRVRTAIDALGCYLGRYRVDSGPPVHRSATCEVVFATDIEDQRPVALKLMRHRSQLEAEIRARRVGERVVSGDMIVTVLGWHTPAGEGLADGADSQRPQPTPCPQHPCFEAYSFALVMERAALGKRFRAKIHVTSHARMTRVQLEPPEGFIQA